MVSRFKSIETLRLTHANLFVTISGRKLERVDEHAQKIALVKLKYDEICKTIDELTEEINIYNNELIQIGNLETKMEDLYQEKRTLIKKHHTSLHLDLLNITDEQTRLELQVNEFEEAILAGEKAISALGTTLDALDSAQGWSTWDLFGGGVISTAIKHSHLDDAEKQVHHAQKALRYFQEELQDVNEFTDQTISIGGFMTFADYFFDGFVVDWMVHGKIRDSVKQVNQTNQAVQELLDRLNKQKEETNGEISNLRYQYQEEIKAV